MLKSTVIKSSIVLTLVALVVGCSTRPLYRYGIPVLKGDTLAMTGVREYKEAENTDNNVLISNKENVVSGFLLLDGEITGKMILPFKADQSYWRLSLTVANGSDEAFSFGPDNLSIRYAGEFIDVPTESDHLRNLTRASRVNRVLMTGSGAGSGPAAALQHALGALLRAKERAETESITEEWFNTYLVPEVVPPGAKHGGYVFFPFGRVGSTKLFSLPEDFRKSPYLVAEISVGGELHELTFRVDLLSDSKEDHQVVRN